MITRQLNQRNATIRGRQVTGKAILAFNNTNQKSI